MLLGVSVIPGYTFCLGFFWSPLVLVGDTLCWGRRGRLEAAEQLELLTAFHLHQDACTEETDK